MRGIRARAAACSSYHHISRSCNMLYAGWGMGAGAERHSGQVLERCPRSRSGTREAHMPSDQISINVICPECKSVGVLVWEKTKSDRVLVSVTRNFYERISKKAPYSIEIVCLGCEHRSLRADPAFGLRARIEGGRVPP